MILFPSSLFCVLLYCGTACSLIHLYYSMIELWFSFVPLRPITFVCFLRFRHSSQYVEYSCDWSHISVYRNGRSSQTMNLFNFSGRHLCIVALLFWMMNEYQTNRNWNSREFVRKSVVNNWRNEEIRCQFNDFCMSMDSEWCQTVTIIPINIIDSPPGMDRWRRRRN